MEFKILPLFSLPRCWVNSYIAFHSISYQQIPWFHDHSFPVFPVRFISFGQVRSWRVYWIRHHPGFKKSTLVSRSSLCISKKAISFPPHSLFLFLLNFPWYWSLNKILEKKSWFYYYIIIFIICLILHIIWFQVGNVSHSPWFYRRNKKLLHFYSKSVSWV